MKLHFMREDALAALKANIALNLRHYREPDNRWIYEYFSGEDPFMELKLDFPAFELSTDYSPEHINETQVHNTRVFYSALKALTDTQATDERIWAGLAHSDLLGYTQARWGMAQGEGCKERDIENHFFYGHSMNKKRALIVNTLSRLWWMGRLTYDPKRKDPFELLTYFREGFTHRATVIFSNNYMSNPTVAHGLLEALILLEAEHYVHPDGVTEPHVEATRYLNVYGGTHILDYYTETEIRDRVLQHMHALQGARFTAAAPMVPTATPPVEEKAPQKAEPTRSGQVTGIPADRSTRSGAVNVPVDRAQVDRANRPEPAEPVEEQQAMQVLRWAPEEPETEAVSYWDLNRLREAPRATVPPIAEPSPLPKPQASVEKPNATSQTATSQTASDPQTIAKEPIAPTQAAPEPEASAPGPADDLLTALTEAGFEYVDKRDQKGFLWVIYDRDKRVRFELIMERFHKVGRQERHGTIATGNRRAWYIKDR